jgi:hypothetical protein
VAHDASAKTLVNVAISFRMSLSPCLAPDIRRARPKGKT